MATREWRQTPADGAAVRAEIITEIPGTTLLTVYAETTEAHGDTEAHRWQDASGTWQSLTYRQVRGRVRDAALGLRAIGMRPGEFAVIWSRNRSEATIADYAVMHARGDPVFLYNTLAPEQVAYITGDCAPACPRPRRSWRRPPPLSITRPQTATAAVQSPLTL